MIYKQALINNRPKTLTEVVANLVEYWGYTQNLKHDIDSLLNEFTDWYANTPPTEDIKSLAVAFADFLECCRQSMEFPCDKAYE
ncbi:hypothetical protein [Runella sp.]|uniref:hypothetical protein n=1 Tax=Runella sp. TaxID=1960881 RepID=UPI003D0BA06A